jgi:hypothetical protein
MGRAEERLAALQHRLSRLIRAPSGVADALAAEGDASGAGLAEWLRGDARASARERLEVYANAYFARLLGALREDFPALAQALGEAAFHDLATAYLVAFPPSRPSLRDAGAKLSAFLAGGTPEAAWFLVRWPFAADLAALEWALVDAFDAPDAEPLSREALAALAPEDWAALPLRLHPAAALLELAFPVQRLREAHDAGTPLAEAALAALPTHICVSRHAERVRFRAVDAREAALLAELRAGTTFGALCARLASEVGDEEAPRLAAAFLAAWGRGQLINLLPPGAAS